jgi:hypothetical protein
MERSISNNTGKPIVALLSSPLETIHEKSRHLAQSDPQLEGALRDAGLEPFWLEWGSDKSLAKAKQSSAILIRSTWNYSDTVELKDSFLEWLRKVVSKPNTSEGGGGANVCPVLLNSLGLVEWNSDKQYLLELQSKGVNIVPTVVVKMNENEEMNIPSFEALAEEWKCKYIIIKPVVGAGARGVQKYELKELVENESKLSEVIASLREQLAGEGTLLIQPFLTSVVEHGEVSVMCMGGEVSYAVLKRPHVGDFIVQVDWGISATEFELTEELHALAKSVLAALPELPTYARLDFLKSNVDENAATTTSSSLLSEAELIEPHLFLEHFPRGAAALAAAVASKIQ